MEEKVLQMLDFNLLICMIKISSNPFQRVLIFQITIAVFHANIILPVILSEKKNLVNIITGNVNSTGSSRPGSRLCICSPGVRL